MTVEEPQEVAALAGCLACGGTSCGRRARERTCCRQTSRVGGCQGGAVTGGTAGGRVLPGDGGGINDEVEALLWTVVRHVQRHLVERGQEGKGARGKGGGEGGKGKGGEGEGAASVLKLCFSIPHAPQILALAAAAVLRLTSTWMAGFRQRSFVAVAVAAGGSGNATPLSVVGDRVVATLGRLAVRQLKRRDVELRGVRL